MRAALLVLATLWSATAHAGGDIGVVVTGEGTMQPQLAAQIESWLSAHGHTLVASPLPPEAITALVDCFVLEDQRCARGVVEKRAKAKTVVYARVESKQTGAGRDITLTAYWFDKGHEAVAERRTCEKCTDQTLRVTADEMMRKLAGSGAGDLGHINFRSSPAGARISIDGTAVGVTPLDWDVAEGKHTILFDKEGRQPESREIVVTSGKTETVDITLDILGHHGGGGESKLLPVGVMALGGALIATGVVLIAIHQDPGPNEPYMIHNTRTAGIGFAIGGAAVAGAGVYLYFFRHESSSAPVAAYSGDSGYIGWAGRF